ENSRGTSPVGVRRLRAHRLSAHTEAAPPAVSDLADVPRQPCLRSGLPRFLHGANRAPARPLCSLRTRSPRPSRRPLHRAAARIPPCTSMPPTSGPSTSPRRAGSCRFPKSAVYTIATSARQRSPPPPSSLPPNASHRSSSAYPLTLPDRESGMTRRSENARRPTSNEVQRLGSVDGSRLLLSEPDEVLAKDKQLPNAIEYSGAAGIPRTRRISARDSDWFPLERY